MVKMPNGLCIEVRCDYCSGEAKLVTGEKIYPHRKDLWDMRFWQCEPCKAHVGCHKNSADCQPLGRLANAGLRKAKMEAHAHFDPIWQNGHLKRKEAYAWLASQLGIPVDKTHIGMFDIVTCRKVVELCLEIKNYNDIKRLQNNR